MSGSFIVFILRMKNKLLRDRAEAARQAHNLKDGGSNPSPATIVVPWCSDNIAPCHGEECGFDSRRNRHLWPIGEVIEHSALSRHDSWV